MRLLRSIAATLLLLFICSSSLLSQSDWGWSFTAAAGASFPMVRRSSSPYGGSSGPVYVPPGQSSGGGGWSTDDATWTYLFEGSAFLSLSKRVYIAGAVGFDRRGKTTTIVDEDNPNADGYPLLYDRLHADYLKLGPQLLYLNDKGQGFFLGINAGLPTFVGYTGPAGSQPFDADTTNWDMLWEAHGGLRFATVEAFDGRLGFNAIFGVALTPMYSYENGNGYYKMFTIRVGLSYTFMADRGVDL